MKLRGTKRAVFASTVVGGAVIVSAITVPALAQPVKMGHLHSMAAPAAVNCEALVGPTPDHQSFTQKLPIPTKIDRRRGSAAVKLTMLAGVHQFSPDLPATPTFGYSTNSSASDVYGGPTIEAMKGVPLKLSVRNALGEHPLDGSLDGAVMGTMATDAMMPRGTLHLHGAHSEPKYDGLPDQPFGVGATNTYVYGNDQDATALWYHDHSCGITRLQVTAGLAGQFWLRDQYDTGDANNPLHLPTGGYEVPLTIQDRMFNADGSESEMCGNGVRCVVLWLARRGRIAVGQTIEIDTDAGPHACTLLSLDDGKTEARVRVAMRAYDTTPGPAQMRASDFQRIAEYAVGIGTNAQRDGQDVIDADFIRLAQQNGLPVHVYTINERPEMERLMRMGVNGLFTDFPDRLQSLIVE